MDERDAAAAAGLVRAGLLVLTLTSGAAIDLPGSRRRRRDSFRGDQLRHASPALPLPSRLRDCGRRGKGAAQAQGVVSLRHPDHAVRLEGCRRDASCRRRRRLAPRRRHLRRWLRRPVPPPSMIWYCTCVQSCVATYTYVRIDFTFALHKRSIDGCEFVWEYACIEIISGIGYVMGRSLYVYVF